MIESKQVFLAFPIIAYQQGLIYGSGKKFDEILSAYASADVLKVEHADLPLPCEVTPISEAVRCRLSADLSQSHIGTFRIAMDKRHPHLLWIL